MPECKPLPSEMSHIEFINNAPALFSNLPSDQPPCWGKMNAQQVVEHLSEFFMLSIGEIVIPLSVPEEQIPKSQAFLFSDKMFRENTKAPLNVMPEEPKAIKHIDISKAIEELRNTISNFEVYYDENPSKTNLHPVFGYLDKAGWTLLHYKHIHHHLKQFQLI
jgi:hypothetical protein